MKHSNEFTKLSLGELTKKLEEKRLAVRQFRFDITGSKIKNIKEGANLRKEVARILTEIGKRNAN